MLILTGSVVGDKTEALCSACHRVVGLFDLDELGDMAKELDAIYCFDCDSFIADSVHPSLYDETGRYFIWFGNVCVPINLWQEVRAKEEIIQHNIESFDNFLNPISGTKGGCQL